jgi:hypothetical protein
MAVRFERLRNFPFKAGRFADLALFGPRPDGSYALTHASYDCKLTGSTRMATDNDFHRRPFCLCKASSAHGEAACLTLIRPTIICNLFMTHETRRARPGILTMRIVRCSDWTTRKNYGPERADNPVPGDGRAQVDKEDSTSRSAKSPRVARYLNRFLFIV